MSIISFFIAFPYANHFFAGSKVLSFLGVVNVLTVIGVPLLSMIMFVSKHVFKTRTSPNFKAGMWAFWIINIICLFFVGSYQGSQFSSHAELVDAIDLTGVSSDTLYIEVGEDHYRSAAVGVGHLRITDDKLVSRHVHFNIVKAEGELFELKQEVYSRGKTESEASRLASSVVYSVAVENNKILLPRTIEFPKGEKWRNQQVNLTLYVPVGKAIYLENTFKGIGYHFEIDRDQEYPRFDEKQTWVMKSDGLVNPVFIRKSQRSDEFKFQDFENLQIDGQLEILIEKGGTYNIAMSGKPSYLDRVEIVQLEKTLNISFENNYHISSPPKITITIPELKFLDTKSTGVVKVQGFTQKEMKIKYEGKKDLNILANIESLELRQSGRGRVTLRGKGSFLKSDLGQSSKLEADRYQVKTARIHGGVSSRAYVAVSDTLWTYKDGGARIENDGSPILFEDSVTDH